MKTVRCGRSQYRIPQTRTSILFSPLTAFALGIVCALSGCIHIQAGIAPTAVQSRFYVSPQGHDSNPGTLNRPFRTLTRAQQAVRQVNANMTGNILVSLASGRYRLSRPIKLIARDSGTNGFLVIYRNMRGARPEICGAVRITGWKRLDAPRNLWAAPAPPQLQDTRQLYINGIRALRTRGLLPTRMTQTSTGYREATTAMASWRNPSNIEFVYTGGNGLWSQPSLGLGAWTEPRCPIAAIRKRSIIMAEPCWRNSTRRVKLPRKFHSGRMANLVGPGHVGKKPAFVENAFELLGTPGQWYLDRTRRMLYYVPRPGEDMAKADVEAPILTKLVTGRGTAQKPIRNIRFSNLKFCYATWLSPDSAEGFSEIQANYTVTGRNGYAVQGLCHLAPGGECPFGNWTQEPGNLQLFYDHHITFTNDIFAHLGAAGLRLGDGSQEDLVLGCIFTDISGNGIELGGVDMPLAPRQARTDANRIEDNHIFNVATEFHGGVGIDVGYARRTLIAHNQLNNLPYTGISIGWGGWPDKIKLPGQANYSANNVVAHNLIFNHMRLLADGGGIYTQGLTGPSLARGEKLLSNVIRNQYGSGHGLYTDNGCDNVTAKGNVIFDTNFDNWGGRHRDYYHNHRGGKLDNFLFEDNYWQQGDPDSSHLGVILRHNHLIDSLRQVPGLILRRAGLQAAYRNLLNVRISGTTAPDAPMRVAAWAADGTAYVAWNPPVSDGGASILSYTVVASDKKQIAISADNFAKSGYVTFHQLKRNRSVRFYVFAVNSRGASPPSLPSAAVTPRERIIHVPGVPRLLAVRTSRHTASIHFRNPLHGGGAPVTEIVLKINPTGRRFLFAGRSLLVLGNGHATFFTVGGLKPGNTYQFSIAAVNAAGCGLFSRRTGIMKP